MHCTEGTVPDRPQISGSASGSIRALSLVRFRNRAPRCPMSGRMVAPGVLAPAIHDMGPIIVHSALSSAHCGVFSWLRIGGGSRFGVGPYAPNHSVLCVHGAIGCCAACSPVPDTEWLCQFFRRPTFQSLTESWLPVTPQFGLFIRSCSLSLRVSF